MNIAPHWPVEPVRRLSVLTIIDDPLLAANFFGIILYEIGTVNGGILLSESHFQPECLLSTLRTGAVS
jgi:hypothetical protein